MVLAPEFLSHDQDQLTKVLQEHVKSVTAPYKYPRKVRVSPPMSPVLCRRASVLFLSLELELQMVNCLVDLGNAIKISWRGS